MQAAKQFCFVIRRAPDDGFRTSELLDMALTTAAFDQPANVVFLDEGVLHLSQGSRNNILDMITAFDLYDIEPPWVETESLQACGISLDDLTVPVRCISRGELPGLLAQQQVLVTG
jgi:tRNA 2-thiouridine synthesizing protein C